MPTLEALALSRRFLFFGNSPPIKAPWTNYNIHYSITPYISTKETTFKSPSGVLTTLSLPASL